MNDKKNRFVLEIKNKAGVSIGYVKCLERQNVLLKVFQIASLMPLIKPKCIFDDIRQAEAMRCHIVNRVKNIGKRLSISIKTKRDPYTDDTVIDLKAITYPSDRKRIAKEQGYTFNIVPYKQTFMFRKIKDTGFTQHGFERAYKTTYKGWTDKNTKCSVCHINTPYEKVFMIGNYAICPFCVKEMGEDANKIIMKLVEEHPTLEQDYHGAKFLGNMGAKNADISAS